MTNMFSKFQTLLTLVGNGVSLNHDIKPVKYSYSRFDIFGT